MSTPWSESTIPFGGLDLVVRRAGRGRPLLVLHEELGDPGPLLWQDALAAERELVLPLHPGFGRSPRAEWLRDVRDLAAFHAGLVRAQKLAPLDVVGFSFGGWVAAEMMAADPTLFRRAILVGAPGIRPAEGEIFDLYTLSAAKYLERSVLDRAATPEYAKLFGGEQTPELFEAWDDARAELSRLAWAPYLHSPSLPQRLALADPCPALLVWGKHDAIVPPAVGEAYARAHPRGKLLLLDRCGHRPEIEQRDAFVTAVRDFLR